MSPNETIQIVTDLLGVGSLEAGVSFGTSSGNTIKVASDMLTPFVKLWFIEGGLLKHKRPRPDRRGGGEEEIEKFVPTQARELMFEEA